MAVCCVREAGGDTFFGHQPPPHSLTCHHRPATTPVAVVIVAAQPSAHGHLLRPHLNRRCTHQPEWVVAADETQRRSTSNGEVG